MAHKNEAWLNGLLSVIYFYSEERTHSVSVETHSGVGRTDSLFYPIEQRFLKRQRSDTVVIHEYKFTNNPNAIENLFE